MGTVGVYVGTNPADVTAFEDFLGRPADYVGVHIARTDWVGWLTNVVSMTDKFARLASQPTFTVPMFVEGGSLSAAASGAYDAFYVQAAKALAAGMSSRSTIYVRTGEEFNLPNWDWAAKGHEQEYIQAYRHFVDAFRSVSGKFKFEWNVNLGDFGMDPATAYPGDAYVDVVGMDFYYKKQWDNPDPLQAWNVKVKTKYGLQWLEDFAKAHGKATAYPEWGVDTDTAGPYLQKAYDWFGSHNVAYQMYWDANQGGFNGALDQYPTTAAAYDQIFGVQSITLAPGIANYALIRAHDDTLIGNLLDNVLIGNPGNNVLKGMAGADTIYGGEGNDTIDGGPGADVMQGGAGDDSYDLDNPADAVYENPDEGLDSVVAGFSYTLPNNVENLTLRYSGAASGFGNASNNRIVGNAGANSLKGFMGDDVLIGGGGDDVIEGGAGKDTLTGGDGADTFVFRAATDSTKTAYDVITDLQNVDRVDFSLIDANPNLAGDQAFTLVSSFTRHAGEAMLYNGAAATYVNLDINGDGTADMLVGLNGSHADFAGYIW